MQTSVHKPKHLPLEKELLGRIAMGDQKAFTSLFTFYQAMVYDFSLRLTRSKSQAQEIVQQIFLKVWLNRENLSAIENFGAYLNRATRNESYSVLRKLSSKMLTEISLTEEGISCESDSAHRLLYNESKAILNEAISKLPPQRKLVYQLCHEQGLKYDEVAAELHISSGTVHKHMKLALKSIREHFKHMDAVVLTILLFNNW